MARFRNFLHQCQPLAWLFAMLLGLHTLTRLVFIGYNRLRFPDINAQEGIRILLRGMQQDLTSIIVINLPFVFLLLAGNNLLRRKAYRYLLFILFLVTNFTGFAVNLMDAGYFAFSHHRSNVEFLHILIDSNTAFRAVSLHYWILILCILVILIILFLCYRRIVNPMAYRKLPAMAIAVHTVVVTLILLSMARGFAERPVVPYTPLLNVEPQHLPAAQNSITTLIYSFIREQKKTITPSTVFSSRQLDSLVPVQIDWRSRSRPALRKNVVFFILESFSREYLQPGHPLKAQTPFLDSLIGKSLFFSNAFANNFSSTHGIVSLLGSIPTLLDEPFFYSPYANLEMQGLGRALKEMGYDTNFFMGAGEDHFGFGKFSKMVGIDHYYSRKDFNDNRFDDGSWGIFDEPFFQFGNRVLSEKKQPFLAVFFNLSSHFPFTLPEQHKERFEKMNAYPAQNSVSYVDFALQQFFSAAEKSDWYQNTLFVFCADHWFPAHDDIPYSKINSLAIPLFFFDPSASEGRVSPALAAQVDVVPTTLDLVGYQGVYKGFGRSLLDTSNTAYVVHPYQGHFVHCISDRYLLGYDPVLAKTMYLHAYQGDSLTSGNLVGNAGYDKVAASMEMYTKAYLQRYHQVLASRQFPKQ